MRADYRQIPYRAPLEQDRWSGGDWRPIIRYLSRHLAPHRGAIVGGILLLTLSACSGYLLAYYSRIVVDRILVVQAAGPGEGHQEGELSRGSVREFRTRIGAPARRGNVQERERALLASPRPAGAGRALSLMFGIFVLTQILLNLAMRWGARMRIRIKRDVTRTLRDDLHRKVLELSKSYHERHPPGRLLARILSDVDMMRQHLVDTVFQFGHQILMVIIGLILLATVRWWMVLVFLCVLVPYMRLVRWFQRRMVPVHREVRHTNSCMYGYVSQKLDSVQAIFAYGREPQERLVFRRLSHCMFRDVLQHERYGAGLNLCAALVTSMCTLGLFLAGSGLVLAEEISLGEMLFAYSITAQLFSPVIGLSQLAGSASSLLVLGQRMLQIMEEPVEVREEPDAISFPSPVQTGFRLSHVRFGYRGEAVLQGVSLNIPSGKWICIMGPSGSGKSTLLHLLGRLYDPDDGQITVDGIPLPKIRFPSLRHHVALVPQEAQIFTGSIRDNITYGDPEATPAEIMEAAKAAEAHDFIMSLPIQYETLVGERGTTLSGGQRQRVSIARALLSRPEVLLLDDVTSALDAETERRIQETLEQLMVGKTAVIVSQRVSMARRCHRICILSGGVFIEEGTHDELIARNGYYARLVAQQMR